MMGLSVLISRNGVTQMAVELAKDLGVMLVARAKSRHYQVFSCHDQLMARRSQRANPTWADRGLSHVSDLVFRVFQGQSESELFQIFRCVYIEEGFWFVREIDCNGVMLREPLINFSFPLLKE